MGDVSEMETLYKACHANPLWSPAEKRKRKESDAKPDVEVCSKITLKDSVSVSNSLMVTSRAYRRFAVLKLKFLDSVVLQSTLHVVRLRASMASTS